MEPKKDNFESLAKLVEQAIELERNTYHPLRDDEWHLLQYIVDHNIELCNTHRVQNEDLMTRVFGKK